MNPVASSLPAGMVVVSQVIVWTEPTGHTSPVSGAVMGVITTTSLSKAAAEAEAATVRRARTDLKENIVIGVEERGMGSEQRI